jgi:hypothetical protein
MKTETVLFIYSDGTDKKVLDIDEAKAQHLHLIKEGYKHTSTIDPQAWINYVANCSQKDLKQAIKDL